MKKRQHLIEQFSTFLQIDDRTDTLDSGWIRSPRLSANMNNKIQEEPQAIEEFWAQSWLREALKDAATDSQKKSLAREHLSAYLEEACYWTTLKICQQLSAYNLRRVDCFLIAREAAAKPTKLFKNYDRQSSSVKTYAQFPIKGAVLDEVRRGREQDKYQWPALLRSTTKKRLQESLKKANIKEPEFSKCVLAYQCFKDKYVPAKAAGSKQLQPPNEKQLQTIAAHYNQLRNSEVPEASSQEIQSLLEINVRSIRNAAKTTFLPLDDCLFESALISEDPLDEQESLDSDFDRLNSILSKAVSDLPDDAQKILKLWYGLGIIQSDLALIFGFKQFQVSRQLGRHKQSLLKALAEWSRDTWEINLNSQQINEMGKQLDAWLEQYCSAPFHAVLTGVLQEKSNENDIQILRLFFGMNLKLPEVAVELRISETVAKNQLLQVQQRLQDRLKKYVESTLLVSLTSLKSADKQFAGFVELFLQKAPYAVWNKQEQKLC